MGSFFNLDGPFNRFGNLLADIVVLSLLWFFFSLPVLTAGASTTALFYVATRRISDKEGYLFKDFWGSFRQNFVQATVVWLCILLFVSGFAVTVSNADVFAEMKTFLVPIQCGFLLELIIVTVFIFPLISRFEMKTTEVVKTAFLMANRHILISLLCIIILAGILLATAFFLPLVFVAAGAYALMASYFIVPVFKKYRPDLDPDSDNYDKP